MTDVYDCIVIGGGAAGLAAAQGASQNGLEKILIIEQGEEAGGILNQCIHNGFGLHTFKEELSGPAYAERFADAIKDDPNIDLWLNSTVTAITPEKEVTVLSSEHGYQKLQAKSIVLAMGSRERTRGAIHIPGSRPNGIYNAGQAQKFLNLEGNMVGRNVFILGSGDIGLIMARRMVLEGGKVLGVAELMPYSNGLARNIKQCLEDFGIPLYLSHTVTEIRGKDQLEQIVVSQVDENKQPIPGSEMVIDCDVLLLSVGLIPDNRITENAGIALYPGTKGAPVDETYMTEAAGIFAAGNVLHIHDLVDFVSQEGCKAGKAAASYVLNEKNEGQAGQDDFRVQKPVSGIGYIVPQKVHSQPEGDVECLFRVTRPMKDLEIRVKCGDFEKTVKKRTAVPAEMEKVILRPSDFEKMNGDVITWEAVQA